MAKRIRLTEMEAYNVKDYHSDLIQRPATLIKPEDIQLIVSGVLGPKTKGRGVGGSGGRGVGNHAAGGPSNDMRSICNNLRLSLQAAFSHAVKAHLSPERMARSGKVFAIKADPVRDVPSVQGQGAPIRNHRRLWRWASCCVTWTNCPSLNWA